MGVEAARLALRAAPGGHAGRRALVRDRGPGLPRQDQRHRDPRRAAARLRLLGARPRRRRRGPASARCGSRSKGPAPRSSSPRTSAPACPTSPDESAGGDGAAALLVGDGDGAPVIAEYLGSGTATEEFLDRWRTPGRPALEGLGGAVRRDEVRAARRAGVERGAEGGRAHPGAGRPRDRHRAARAGRPSAREAPRRRATARSSTTSRRPSATPAPRIPALLLTSALEQAAPGRGRSRSSCSPTAPTCCCSARPTRSPATRRRAPVGDAGRGRRRRPVRQVPRLARDGDASSRRAGRSRRASPAPRPGVPRTGSSASSGRATAASGALHLPPARVSMDGGAVDDMEAAPMADVAGHDRDVHHRPARVLAEPADRVRGRRLRRWWPVPGRAHRRRRRTRCRSATGSR